MKPCWQDAGLTERGAKVADAVIDEMVALVTRSGPLAKAVLDEALFRVYSLPTLTPAVQRRYRKANGIEAPR